MPDPTPVDPSPISLDHLERTIEALLAADPAKVQRVQDFFDKLKKVQPILDLVIRLLAKVH